MSVGIHLASLSPRMDNRRDPCEKLWGKHILIVEDRPTMTSRVTQYLAKHGHLSYAASGKQALEAIAARPPDIILLDVTLPDMTCAEIVRSVRQNRATEHILIVAMSEKPPERSQCLAAGCDHFILKPFGPKKLLDRLSGLSWR